MTTRKAAMRVVFICLRVAVFVLIVLGLVYAGQSAFRYSHAIFSDQAMEKAPGKDMKLELSRDMSGKDLAQFLEEHEMIRDAKEFRIQMKYHGCPGEVKAGTYIVNTSMKPSELLEVLFGEAGGDT